MQPVVSRWERGQETPRLDALVRVLRATGFEADLVVPPPRRRGSQPDSGGSLEHDTRRDGSRPTRRRERVPAVRHGGCRRRRHCEPRGDAATLAEHDVRFVLIGGYAAVLHGSAAFTTDADICPARITREPPRSSPPRIRAMDGRIRTSTPSPRASSSTLDDTSCNSMKMVNLVTGSEPSTSRSSPPASRRLRRAPAANAVEYRDRRHHRQGRLASRHHPLEGDGEPPQGPYECSRTLRALQDEIADLRRRRPG